MVEYLAIPQWRAPSCTLADWSASLASLGLEPRIVRDEDRDDWLEVPSIRTRGLAVLDGLDLEAIHFEIPAADAEQVVGLLMKAAEVLRWELHLDDDDDDDAD